MTRKKERIEMKGRKLTNEGNKEIKKVIKIKKERTKN